MPAGQGLISLSLSLPVGGGSLRAYTAATLVVMAGILACYLAAYPVLKPAAFILPSIALFFAARSSGSYLVMLIPAAVAAAVTTQRPPLSTCWRKWKWVVGAAAASCAAVPSSPPLAVPARWSCPSGQCARPASWPPWNS